MNLNQAVAKERLKHWVLLNLRRALTPHNTIKELSTTWIFSFNKEAMNKHLAPSEVYYEDSNKGSGNTIGLDRDSTYVEEQQPK